MDEYSYAWMYRFDALLHSVEFCIKEAGHSASHKFHIFQPCHNNGNIVVGSRRKNNMDSHSWSNIGTDRNVLYRAE